MIELEILVQVYSPIEITKRILDKFAFLKETKIVDTYYYDPIREGLKPYKNNKLYSSFRVREKGIETLLTYKNDHYTEGKWIYSDEYETKIENTDTIKEIITNLGLKELLVLDSTKHFYKFNEYEIVLEEVKNLGTFLEVELQKEITQDEVTIEKKKIQTFINSLNLNVSEELNAGKPELYLKKHNIKV